MEPRGFVDTWVRVGIISALGFTILSTVIMGGDVATALPLGFLFGAMFGLAMAPMLAAITVRISVPEARRGQVVHDLDLILAQLDYHLDSSHEGYRNYSPSATGDFILASLKMNPRAGQNIVITFLSETVTVVGPRMMVRKVERKFHQPQAA